MRDDVVYGRVGEIVGIALEDHDPNFRRCAPRASAVMERTARMVNRIAIDNGMPLCPEPSTGIVSESILQHREGPSRTPFKHLSPRFDGPVLLTSAAPSPTNRLTD
jgi:hypothetical protein